MMKIATYNINRINGRLGNLLRWLKEAQPDIVCLQELKCGNSSFPEKRLKTVGYNAIWQGQKSWNEVAILAKTEIKELLRDLPGDDDQFTHSRYIEVFTNNIVIGCIYLPNGNPWPGPKFGYKLRWFQRLADHAKDLVNRELPVILAGDYNVMPTDLDTYKPEKYVNNALFRPESKQAYKDLVSQGWTGAIRRLYPNERIYTFWDYLRNAYSRDAGLRLDHFLLNLDPDKNTFEQVIEAAQIARQTLDAIDVPSYPKSSGSTGMHIYIPLGAKYTYDQSQLFANIIVKIVHQEIPGYTSLERMIANRKRKMYLDFLQNRPGATIAGPYSLRPKPGATVSMPLSWDEVRPGLTMRHFTIHNSIQRLRETGDLFKGVLGKGIDLAKTIQKAQTIF